MRTLDGRTSELSRLRRPAKRAVAGRLERSLALVVLALGEAARKASYDNNKPKG